MKRYRQIMLQSHGKEIILIDQVCRKEMDTSIIVELGTPHLWTQSGE